MLKEQRPTPPLNQTCLQALWPVQTKMPEKQYTSTRRDPSAAHSSSLWTFRFLPPNSRESFSSHKIALCLNCLASLSSKIREEI